MTTISYALRAELVDEVTEAVATPDNPLLRAIAIRAILSHVAEAVTWRQGIDSDDDEQQSLAALTTAAEQHLQRMRETALSRSS